MSTFSVDGTLIESGRQRAQEHSVDGTGRMSRRDLGANRTVDFHGEPRSNATHVSSTDPEAKLYCKARGQAAKLSYMGHVLMGSSVRAGGGR